jgi:glycosyltransferase involved in cell wall biosynthesis
MNQKNHTFLIDVFNEVYKKFPQSRLLLIGDGDLIENIRSKVKKLGLEKYVIFTGNIKNVNEMYQVMDVLVLPSLYEGLPVVLIEAQASGLKCIVSDKVDERSALTDQVEFIPLNDYKNWAEIITKNIDKHHADNRRIDNRTILEEKGYSIKIEAKKLENYYLSKIQ